MTFGAGKRLVFPFLLVFLFVSSIVYMSFGSFEKYKQNSFFHLYRWRRVHHSVHHLDQSHTLDCHGINFGHIFGKTSSSTLSLLLSQWSMSNSSSEPGYRINSTAWKLFKVCHFTITKERRQLISAHFNNQREKNLGLVGLFSDNQSNYTVQICKQCQMMQDGSPFVWVWFVWVYAGNCSLS